MKKTTISLSIPQPCDEPWDEMYPLQSGRHCDRCSKTVADLTRLSDQQLIDLFSSNNGKLCGRLREDQMQRLLVPEKQNERHSFLKPALAGISLLLSFTIGKSQNITEKPPHILKTSWISYYGNESNSSSGPKSLNGSVQDSVTNQPLNGALIMVRNTSFSCTSDTNGWFQLSLPGSFDADSIQLEISCDGYAPRTIELTAQTPMYATLEPVTIHTKRPVTELGGYIVAQTAFIKNRIPWGRLRHLFWKWRHRK